MYCLQMTSILITDPNYGDFKQKVCLTYISQWFKADELVPNITKTNTVTFSAINSAHVQLIEYSNTTIT
jgi:hypothetical protein